MNVPTVDDVLVGVKTRLEAESGWASLVVGGTHAFRRPQQKSFPYAVLTVEEREPAYEQSDGTYLQDFAVEASVWVQGGDAAAADTAAPAGLLQKALGWVPSDPANGVSVANAVSVVHVKPVGGSLELTDELKLGHDILAAGRKIEVRIQGKRG